jgi:hypothetical protein
MFLYPTQGESLTQWMVDDCKLFTCGLWAAEQPCWLLTCIDQYSGEDPLQISGIPSNNVIGWWPSLFCFVLVGLRFELRALRLQTKHSIAWDTPPIHFSLVILEVGVLGTYFCPDWPLTTIFPISVSQVASTTAVSHWCPACNQVLNTEPLEDTYLNHSNCSIRLTVW